MIENLLHPCGLLLSPLGPVPATFWLHSQGCVPKPALLYSGLLEHACFCRQTSGKLLQSGSLTSPTLIAWFAVFFRSEKRVLYAWWHGHLCRCAFSQLSSEILPPGNEPHRLLCVVVQQRGWNRSRNGSPNGVEANTLSSAMPSLRLRSSQVLCVIYVILLPAARECSAFYEELPFPW